MEISSRVASAIHKNLGVMLMRHDKNDHKSRKLQKPFLDLASLKHSSCFTVHSIRGAAFASKSRIVAAATPTTITIPTPTPTSVSKKRKVVFIMGSTGSGKSRLSIDVATHYFGEVINSDKMQIYKGLDIITNKIGESERRGVPHHLLGEVDPDAEFTACDFCAAAISAINRIAAVGRVPIVVGGSNSFVEALVQDPATEFKSKYDACFVWLKMAKPVLDSYLARRVDEMVKGGLVEEVKQIFSPDLDYNRGIYRSIGVPEMDAYLRAERKEAGLEKEALLKEAIGDIKANTCKLASKQVGKIEMLRKKLGWEMHEIDTTHVFEKRGEEAEAAWEMMVKKPTFEMLDAFMMIR